MKKVAMLLVLSLLVSVSASAMAVPYSIGHGVDMRLLGNNLLQQVDGGTFDLVNDRTGLEYHFNLTVADGVVTGQYEGLMPGWYQAESTLTIDGHMAFVAEPHSVDVNAGQTLGVYFDYAIADKLYCRFAIEADADVEFRNFTDQGIELISAERSGDVIVIEAMVPLSVSQRQYVTFTDGFGNLFGGVIDFDEESLIGMTSTMIGMGGVPVVTCATTGSLYIEEARFDHLDSQWFIQSGDSYYVSLQEAIDAGCEEINLGEGEYPGFGATYLNNRNLTIRGLGINQTKIIPAAPGVDAVICLENGHVVELFDLTVDGQSTADRSVVTFENYRVNVMNCLIKNNRERCLDSWDNGTLYVNQTAIVGPDFAGTAVVMCPIGILINNTPEVTVRNSVIGWVYEGLYVSGIRNFRVGRNCFHQISFANCYDGQTGQVMELEDNFDMDPMLTQHHDDWIMDPSSPCWGAGYNGMVIGPDHY